MNVLHIILDQDGSGEDYDKLVAEVESGTDYASGLLVVSKRKGTLGGEPVVMLRFNASTPDGDKPFPVCYVTTLHLFLAAAQALQGAHGTPEGIIGIIGTKPADQWAGHERTCGLRTSGLCTCGKRT